MNTDRYVELQMALPQGQKCCDCIFFSYCKQLFNCSPDNTHCDWAPSRFNKRTWVVQ
jgi:hypothetical protein